MRRSAGLAGGLAAPVLLLALGCGAPPGREPVGAPQPAAGPATVTPVGEPATHYVAGPSDRSDSDLARAIHARLPELGVSACLERAAAQYVRTPAATARRLPLAATEFLLHWAGCPDPTAAVLVIETDNVSTAPVVDKLAEVVPGSAYTQVGAASATDGGGFARRWVVLLAERSFELVSVPRRVATGGTLQLQFKLAGHLREPRVVATLPSGVTERATAGSAAPWGVAAVRLSSVPGRQWVELVADGARGPEVVSLFPVWVGESPPSRWQGELLPADPGIATSDEAERFIVELVNRERARFGLKTLAPDPTLRAVARRHSADMAANHYFGHNSPSEGGMQQRLRAAGYVPRFAAENVAEASSLVDAHESLMRSPGHRANILASEATAIGVGVARGKGPGGAPTWIISEELASPLERSDPYAIAQALRDGVDAVRRTSSAAPLEWRFELDDVATAAARRVMARGSDRRALLAAVRGELQRSGIPYRRVAISTGQAFAPGDLQTPGGVDDPGVDAGGVGVAEGADPATPSTWVLVLIGG